MFKNFQEFIQEKIIQEAVGASAFDIMLTTDFEPLSGLLTLIQDRNPQKARVLNWVMGEGLMQASMNREQLLNDVENVASGINVEDDTVGFPGNKPLLKAEMVRAGNALALKGHDGELQAQDLFSPEARNRIKILQQIDEERLMPGGKTIDEYWMTKYEPKFIIVNNEGQDNNHSLYNLEKIREVAKSKSLQPFYFGGTNGFIQWIESGAWKPSAERNRTTNNINNQDGPSVSPEKDANGNIRDDVIGWTTEDGRAKPVYHFHGFPYVVDSTRANNVIQGMQKNFRKIAKQIRTGTEVENPEEREHIEKIKQIMDFVTEKKRNISQVLDGEIDDDGNFIPTKRRRKRNNVIDSSAKGQKIKQIDPDIDVDLFKDLVKKGLSYPFGLKNKKNRLNMQGANRDGSKIEKILFRQFANQADGMEEVDDLLIFDEQGREVGVNKEVLNKYANSTFGWFYEVPKQGKVIYKYSQKQQEQIFDAIFSGMESGYYQDQIKRRSLDSFHSLFHRKRQDLGQGKFQYEDLLQGSDESKVFVKSVIENALEYHPDVMDKIDFYSYQIKDIDASEYTGVLPNREIVLQVDPRSQNNDMGDQTLNTLFKKGFFWEGKHEKGKHPFLDSKVSKAAISNGRNRFLVEKRLGQNGEQIFVLIQPDTNYETILDKIVPTQVNLGDTGGQITYGSRNVKITSGQGGRHISGNALGDKDWQYMLSRLKRGCGGGLGENKEICGHDVEFSTQEVYRNELELPCVQGAVGAAKFEFNGLKGTEFNVMRQQGKDPSSMFEDLELLNWAVEGLRLWSADRAYQVGWITPQEYRHYIGNFYNKEVKKDNRYNHGDELWKQNVFDRNLPVDPKERRDRVQKTRQPQKQQGFGFLALMKRMNALTSSANTPEEQEQLDAVVNGISDWLRDKQNSNELNQFGEKKLLIDYMWEENKRVGAAAARAGFEFRKRKIKDFVRQKMVEHWNDEKRKGARGFGTGKRDETGQEINIDPVQGSTTARANLGGSYADVGKQNLSPEELKQLQQQGKLVAPNVRDTTNRTTPKIAATVRSQAQQQINPDDYDIDDLGQLVPKSKPTPTQQYVPIKPQAQQQINPDDYDIDDLGQLVPKSKPTQPTGNILDDLDLESAQTRFNDADWEMNDQGEIVPCQFKKNIKLFNIKLNSFSEWRNKFQEMVGTYAIINPRKKPKDGDGYNVWGAAGKLGGVSITGKANSSKEDPDGERDRRHGREKRGRK